MKQYLIGITGHRPQKFRSQELAKKQCDDVAAIMKRHYGDSLVFNLGGCIGADQWMGEACLAHNIRYNLFLPFPPDIQSKHWYDYQQQELYRQVSNCNSLSITGQTYDVRNYHIRDRQIVDNSDFIVAFWEGSKHGGTYETIKYGVQNSKIVLNALTDLTMLTMDQLIKEGRYDK